MKNMTFISNLCYNIQIIYHKSKKDEPVKQKIVRVEICYKIAQIQHKPFF